MPDTVGGAGWVLSIGGVLSSRVAGAVAVSSRGSAGVVEATGGSICCAGGSVAWARLDGDSFSIGVVAASLDDVTGERLSGMDFCVTGAWGFGASEVMCSADGAA